MSDTPIFESEKHLRRQRKRHFVILIAAVILLLAVAAAVLIFAGKCSGAVHPGGEDLPFAYSWKQAFDGSAVLSVNREGELVWRIQDAGKEYGTVGFTSIGDKDGVSEFKLIPNSEGRAMASIVLGNKDGTAGDKYSMELLTEAYKEGGKLRCRVLSASCKPISDALVTDGAFPYRIYTDSDGDTVMEIESVESDWECVSSNEDAVRIIGVVFDEVVVRAYLRGGTPGSSDVTLKSALEGMELKASFTLDENGGLKLDEDTASTFEPAKTPAPEQLIPTPEAPLPTSGGITPTIPPMTTDTP